jgi:hypothetical protein
VYGPRVILCFFTFVATACAGSTSRTASPPTAQATPSAAATPADPNCDGLPTDTGYTGPSESAPFDGSVPADANIFGAGRNEPPGPGSGGQGSLPPVVELPGGASRVTFSDAGGELTPITQEPDSTNGPAGDGVGPTNVKSYVGISGILHRTNRMFLVGVFLGDEEPAAPSPPRLDFSETEITTPGVEYVGAAFASLEPAIGQSFLIGDGEGRSYVVPEGATRLFLGFADAPFFEGCPGYYGNNDGEATISIDISTG